MSKIMTALAVGSIMAISVSASAFDVFEGTFLSDNWEPGSSNPGSGSNGNSYIKRHNAYGPGQHMDQFGQNVTIQPMYGHRSGSNTLNRIERHNAYGPGQHMNQFGQPVTVQPQFGGMNTGASPW